MTEPGWYQDPASWSTMRWWDGQRWTNDVRPAAGGPGGTGSWGPGRGNAGPVPFGPDPRRDLEQLTKAGRTVSQALLAGALAYAALYIFDALVFHRLWTAIRRFLDTPVAGDGTRPTLVLPPNYAAYNLVIQVVNLVIIVVGILFVIWLYQAATVAQRRGLPARHSPVWAVVAWIIPIINLWFPYQSAVDLFPPGHPGRRKVGRWWALWLGSNAAGLALLVASLASVPLALALALVASVLSFAAAFAARDMIAEVSAVNGELGGRWMPEVGR